MCCVVNVRCMIHQELSEVDVRMWWIFETTTKMLAAMWLYLRSLSYLSWLFFCSRFLFFCSRFYFVLFYGEFVYVFFCVFTLYMHSSWAKCFTFSLFPLHNFRTCCYHSSNECTTPIYCCRLSESFFIISMSLSGTFILLPFVFVCLPGICACVEYSDIIKIYTLKIHAATNIVFMIMI